MIIRRLWLSVTLAFTAAVCGSAQPFGLPTANRALFEPGREEAFFVGTVGKPWTSGTFGCVRTEGWQMHEGLDIRAVQRDKRGEAADPVMASTDGVVVYINRRPSRSNYGNYVILRHQVEGIEVCTVYSHLREARADLQPGQSVKRGETVGILGRTSNTGQAISKERAHLHFEINLFINERFSGWYKQAYPGQRDDHGIWNGQNLIGLDPRLLLLEQQQKGADFRLLDFVRKQTELCRVTVRKTQFPWLKRYAALVKSNPRATQEGVAGYELVLNYVGLPFEVIPRAASELKGTSKYRLVSVNAEEYRKHPCRRLVAQKGTRFELATRGINLLDILTY